MGHPILAFSWECFVIENLLSVAPFNAQPYFYRTAKGAEIDLVLEFNAKDLWAIEIKNSTAPKISKGFYAACEDLKPNKKFVVYSGRDTFVIKEDITVITLYDLMKILKYS